MTKGLRFVTDPTGRFHVVFDATGGLHAVMPVISGGDGTGDGGGGDGGSGSGGAGGTGGGSGGEGGSAGGDGGGTGGEGNDPPAPEPSKLEKEALDAIKALKDQGTEIPKALETVVSELKRARDDAAKARTKAKEDAAKEAVAELTKKLAGALGIETDDDSKDPEKLLAKLTEKDSETEAARAETTQLKVKDAVRDACDEHSAHFKATYGSLLADDKLAKLDPNADDFNKQVSDLVQATIKDNEHLKKGRVPGKSGSDLNGGGSSDGKRPSLGKAVDAKLGAKS